MLQACLNGGRTKAENPSIPVGHAEIAADAVTVRIAGAQELHVHPRNALGAESLDPDDVGQCLEMLRASVPDMPIGVGTGAWIEPCLTTRLELIETWTVKPDYASVNLNEAGAVQVIEMLQSLGISIEAGLWNVDDARHFLELGLADSCLRILVEMIFDDPVEAEREYGATMAVLNEARIAAPILLHGNDRSAWRMVELAARHGHDTRMGFEDCLLLPSQRQASSNSELIATAREILRRR